MQIQTKVKDAFLTVTLYLLIVLSWLYGWSNLGMTWEFLYAPLMFAVMRGCTLFDQDAEPPSILMIFGTISDRLLPDRCPPVLSLFTALAALSIVVMCNGCVLIAFIFALLFVNSIPYYFKDILAKTEPAEKYINTAYFKILNLPNLYIEISAFLIFPPFISFSFLYLLRKIGDFIEFVPFYALISVVTILLSASLMPLYNRLLLRFHYASQNERKRQRYIFDCQRLFCKEHFLKPLRVENALFYYGFCCRINGCPGKFIAGVGEVTGVIGCGFDGYRTEQDRIYVSLWSESDKKAVNADIDILEIREARETDYDYAINAVLVTLKNDASRPREYVRRIPVVIRGNPPIPEGAMRILEHEFGEIRKG
ncbi:hypothetical protein QUF80_18875 [Desulfococcaceae bacterium HSG8]|nr:hypothetical protein [Desulfococcaceae bacterium HSG8]